MPISSPIASWLATYGYPIAYPLTIVQGPVVMLIAGFLVRLNVLAFWPIYFVLIAGDLTGDVMWYWIGRHGARRIVERYGKFLNITEKDVEKAETFFHDHQVKILFISKITMGFGFALATLIAAGAARVPFKKYLTVNFFGQFVWTALLVGAGYFLGNLYAAVARGLRVAFLISLIILGTLAVYGLAKFVHKWLGDKITP